VTRTPAPPLSRKRRPAENDTPPASTKKPRLTGSAAAIGRMSQSMEHFADVIGQAWTGTQTQAPPAETSPQRMTKAILRAQELEHNWLTSQQMINFLLLLENSSSTATVYNSINNDKLRKQWIRTKLDISSPWEDDEY
jgi:hypothetical protein